MKIWTLAWAGCALAGCAGDPAPVPPRELVAPDARLMASPSVLPELPIIAKGNAPMVQSYAQCRVAHADEADKRLGLIGYVRAARNEAVR